MKSTARAIIIIFGLLSLNSFLAWKLYNVVNESTNSSLQQPVQTPKIPPSNSNNTDSNKASITSEASLDKADLPQELSAIDKQTQPIEKKSSVSETAAQVQKKPVTSENNETKKNLLDSDGKIHMKAGETKEFNAFTFTFNGRKQESFKPRVNVEKYTTYSGYHTAQGDVNAPFSTWAPANNSPYLQASITPNVEFSLMPKDIANIDVTLRTSKDALPGRYRITVGNYMRYHEDNAGDRIRGNNDENFKKVSEKQWEIIIE
jgi:hypothetical protein